jgi:hypothetical protein
MVEDKRQVWTKVASRSDRYLKVRRCTTFSIRDGHLFLGGMAEGGYYELGTDPGGETLAHRQCRFNIQI